MSGLSLLAASLSLVVVAILEVWEVGWSEGEIEITFRGEGGQLV